MENISTQIVRHLSLQVAKVAVIVIHWYTLASRGRGKHILLEYTMD
jgi:hypothetical protein